MLEEGSFVQDGNNAETSVETFINISAAVLGLTIEPHQRPGVRVHLEAARRLTALLETAPLPPSAENAPVFRP